MEKTKAIMLLQSTTEIMNWDMETKMPPRGLTLRSEQLALLSGLEHKMITDQNVGILLGNIEGHRDYKSLAVTQQRNVYLFRKNYAEQTKLPENLVINTAKQRAITIDTWKKAKNARDFSRFKPEFEKLLNMRKKAAEILMDVKKTSTPYDALLDIYEPKMTSERITRLFNKLKDGLISVLEKCEAATKQPNSSILQRKVPLEIQQKITYELVKFLGYDIESENANGRIDETEHPFTTGYYNDVRITTHYYENIMTASLFSILHESGHALYEQHLNPDWIYRPIGAAASLGFHESQSRLIENMIGRSHAFWAYFFPKLTELTGSIFSDVNLDTFVFAINQVKPSKIRVEADEVTYGLHIIIRFEIERDLMEGKITVAELPEVWNQKYKDYLNIDIAHDAEGVLQDIHWASGSIGYFPTYALGNILSGQILDQMRKHIPDWRNQISQGYFHSIGKWLGENVHRYGNLYDPDELIKKISGEEINIAYYLNYLNEKFGQLYEL
jgi:carboxypeptidase Taq